MNNIKYEIIVYWSDEDNAFIAEMPELPGCMSDGKTYEEVIQNIKVIAEEWIKTAKELGWDIPEPKGKLYYAQFSNANMIFEERKDNFLLSTDKVKLDINLIHDFLCNKS